MSAYDQDPIFTITMQKAFEEVLLPEGLSLISLGFFASIVSQDG